MHYANGRPAQNGDKVFQYTGSNYEPPVFGILFDATPGNDYCNGQLVPLNGGPRVGCCLADCLRLDDMLAALGFKSNAAGDTRKVLSLVPQHE